MNLYGAAVHQINQTYLAKQINFGRWINAAAVLNEAIDEINKKFDVYIPIFESELVIDNTNLFLVWYPPEDRARNGCLLAIHFGLVNVDSEIKLRPIEQFEYYAYINRAISYKIAEKCETSASLILAAAKCIEYNRKYSKGKK